MLRVGAFLITAAAFAGCSTQYHEPVLGNSHPASPQAATGAEPARSGTLSRSSAAPEQQPEPAPSGQAHQHDDGGAPAHDGAHGGINAAAPTLYACPMHPHVTSTDPESRCPECGMKLTQPVKGAKP